MINAGQIYNSLVGCLSLRVGLGQQEECHFYVSSNNFLCTFLPSAELLINSRKQ